ncbi:hypothetical protein DMC30DRAFT_284568 [Rhodotorula diobovata]|uniref:Uncharacterized protein n=1 Tax=Rhodotorula diobovata TaxID=5288 RepID=A0A5C5FUH1_9BASI|nr:hypothetical protein DMC30DRAFT_284568 [Rhodotorula diobovata]
MTRWLWGPDCTPDRTPDRRTRRVVRTSLGDSTDSRRRLLPPLSPPLSPCLSLSLSLSPLDSPARSRPTFTSPPHARSSRLKPCLPSPTARLASRAHRTSRWRQLCSYLPGPACDHQRRVSRGRRRKSQPRLPLERGLRPLVLLGLSRFGLCRTVSLTSTGAGARTRRRLSCARGARPASAAGRRRTRRSPRKGSTERSLRCRGSGARFRVVKPRRRRSVRLPAVDAFACSLVADRVLRVCRRNRTTEALDGRGEPAPARHRRRVAPLPGGRRRAAAR